MANLVFDSRHLPTITLSTTIMKIAVIDCGSNTFNLLIADVTPHTWKVIFQNKLPVKLGAGGFEESKILMPRFYRGLDALLCHKENIQNFHCEKTFAFATSAIREASNGHEFVDRAKAFGINIEVISGDKEAELIYSGVRQTCDPGNEKILIMDIGGGSTEFVIADGSKIFWKESFLLGVSRLQDLVKLEDKMSEIDIDNLDKMLTNQLATLADALKKFPVVKLIGSSGSFDTLLMLYYDRLKKDPSEILLYNEIPMNAFNEVHQWLANSTYIERLKHPMIPSIRAENMPLASYLVSHVLKMQKFSGMFHSGYSLKEGAMKQTISRIDWSLEKEIEKEKPEDYLEE